MSNSHQLLSPIYQQEDLTAVKVISVDKLVKVYKAIKKQKGSPKKQQTVRVLEDIHNYYALKREKDLLHYLNQFKKDFPRFNEIRKSGFSYLQFFDYFGKTSLKDKVKKAETLSVIEAKKLLKNMISTLKSVHDVGFVHTNIRPENIVLGKKRYYLVDWSRAIPSLSSYETELIVGDQKYCPPERLNGEFKEEGDIYALGCTLYFALTGKHIYGLNKVDCKFDQLYAQAFHSPRKLNKLPLFWRQLIVWMTQKEVSKRPNLEELQQWCKDETVPKVIRLQKKRIVKGFPKDSLTALFNANYYYAQFKKASSFEASGKLEDAVKLYENSAFHGCSLAGNNLGNLYEKGSQVRQSYIKAMNLYHQGFQKGNPESAYRLAVLFEKGLGVKVNLIQAYKLYKFSAMRGYLVAQNKLGILYWKGKGVKKDRVQSRFWLGMAAYYGDKKASQNIKILLRMDAG